ncbi:hypothetical protein [Flavivirga algicola]|uniref:Outer membrane protein beta-barrel domain-containing protein n=1 Tax=Flavivirga algicola TaxID=2729136 RepID=A0ABX1RSL3_9FLAO|nr:hypothetical protein [Flavivirga algicola]NMH86063.1 hypothetical protein [Flavivirga algicola]
MKKILLTNVLLASILMSSQEDKTSDSFTVLDDTKIEGELKSYSSYFSQFYLNENWLLRNEMEERITYGLDTGINILEYRILGKYLIDDKLSVLAGPKVNILKKNGNIENVSPFLTFGAQYNVTKEFSIFARYNQPIIKDKTNTGISPSVINNINYRIGTRLKF